MPVDLRPGARASPAAASPRLSAGRCDLALEDDRYRIVRSQGGLPLASEPALAPRVAGTLGGTSLEDVAPEVGLDFRQGAFRFGVSNDTTVMMGGGLCWLDYDADGWLDLFVVNSYADVRLIPSTTHRAGCHGALCSATSAGDSRT